ncbi:deoxyribose-phosphate aldolase [Zhengella mangrovi]|uniref:Deoxyribose-phosphate aldolase n=1 Tax=Zhengella mangrovi TaxID=1982044 RepID=A0A2G1QTD0_9HYPH|nr:deoxyribose-phosphate aldolase [Zhengella mangrovi]PHP68806.1 deoxyribose-phosphate aldolase [Zhengella mangrovi]
MAESAEAAVAARLIACLDYTELGNECTEGNVDRLLDGAMTPAGPVAAVCVWPRFVSQCRERLEGTGVRIATVVNFPDGKDQYEGALDEARRAVRQGADEIDMVITRAKIPSDPDFVTAQVAAFVEAAGGQVVKAILESGEMAGPDDVRIAARAAIAGGAGFIKTSTGKTAHGASLEAARVMLEEIRASGKPVGLKPSGGVRTLADGKAYLDLADEIMGAGWATPQTFRIGASGIMSDLLAHLGVGTGEPTADGGY